MSTKRRPRQESSNKETEEPNEETIDEDIEEWLDDFDIETTPEKKEQQTEKLVEKKNAIEEDTSKVLEKFILQLPKWVDKPWMYVKPTHDGHLQSWIKSWKELILSYSRILAKHVINLHDLKEVHPFTHKMKDRSLTIDQLVYLIEQMVNENLAKWLDNKKNSARIYYKSDKEWAELVYEYLLDTGMAAEVLTIYELKNLDEEWCSLPRDELVLVLDELVEAEKAKWIDNDKESITIIY